MTRARSRRTAVVCAAKVDVAGEILGGDDAVIGAALEADDAKTGSDADEDNAALAAVDIAAPPPPSAVGKAGSAPCNTISGMLSSSNRKSSSPLPAPSALSRWGWSTTIRRQRIKRRRVASERRDDCWLNLHEPRTSPAYLELGRRRRRLKLVGIILHRRLRRRTAGGRQQLFLVGCQRAFLSKPSDPMRLLTHLCAIDLL